MTDSNQILHFDIATPRPGPQQCSGRPLAIAEEAGAGGDPVHGDVHMPDGAGGNPMQLIQAQGPPASLAPRRDRDRSVTPRRGHLLALRSGSSPPERERALNPFQRSLPMQMPNGEQY